MDVDCDTYTDEDVAWLAMVEEQDALFESGAYDWLLCDA